MKKYRVGIVGATGMVGQRFATLLENHPWFEVVALAASPRSAGKTYKEAVGAKWCMAAPIPANMADIVVMDAAKDIDKMAAAVDFVFCAVDMKKDEIKVLEEAYAKAECPVISNNSANRHTPDVPMIVPELNPEHSAVIAAQRKRLGTKRGFIAVKSNCSLQSYVPALFPLDKAGYKVKDVLVCTYQAISGAGKTFETWPEMVDNVIPYIGGEEEKSEIEPLKIWGKVEGEGKSVQGAEAGDSDEYRQDSACDVAEDGLECKACAVGKKLLGLDAAGDAYVIEHINDDNDDGAENESLGQIFLSVLKLGVYRRCDDPAFISEDGGANAREDKIERDSHSGHLSVGDGAVGGGGDVNDGVHVVRKNAVLDAVDGADDRKKHEGNELDYGRGDLEMTGKLG